MPRGWVDSTNPRSACTYPSPGYSAKAGWSAKRTSSVYPARGFASSRTPPPRTTTRASRSSPPKAAASRFPTVMSSGVDGATRPSRCSAMRRTPPATGSPAHEALVPQHLGQLLRLVFHGSGDHLRMAFRGGRRETPDSEGIRERDRIPSVETEDRRGQFFNRLPRRLHDRGQGRIPRGVRAELNREQRRQRDRVDTLEPAFEFACDFELAFLDDDARDHAGVWQAKDPSQQASGRRGHIVVRLHTSQDEIVGHRPDRGREDPCVLADIEPRWIVVSASDGLLRTLRECLSQHLLGPLRAEREGDHATSVFLLDPDGFFQSEFVRRVQFVVQRVPSDVLPVRRNLELQVRVRDLFEAYHDVEGHGGREEETDAISSFPNDAESRFLLEAQKTSGRRLLFG